MFKILKKELGDPDESGRRRPIPVKSSEFQIETDVAIPALGARANPLLTKNMSDLRVNRSGYITAQGVFASGDLVTGSATVILAMGAGRGAANAVTEHLKWKHWEVRC